MKGRAGSLALLAIVVAGVPFAVAACGKTKGSTRGVAECDALRASAEASAKQATELVTLRMSDLACYVNADCVELPPPSCVPNCGGYAVPKGARKSVERLLHDIDEGACKTWATSDCAKIAPMPMASCPAYVPACKDKRCVMRNSSEILPAAECDALRSSANRDQEAALRNADRACKTDDDCTLSVGGCVGGCGGPAVAKRGEAAYKAEHAKIDATCKKWWEGDCMSTTPQPIPSCAPIRARCVGGQCTAAAGP